MAETRADIYTRITNEIVAAIEAGAGTWTMPWHHDGSSIARPVNIASGKVYRGVNTVALWIAAQFKEYGSGIWGTYRQWAKRGAQVRKGEKATTIVFWKQIRGKEEVIGNEADASDEDGGERPRFFARGYAVFNRAQVDGFEDADAPPLPETERIAHAEAFFGRLDIPVTYGVSGAWYRISEDRIYMPEFEQFTDAVGFYSTLAHECAHATGAAHRLDRDFSKRFTNQAVAAEELVAELTAAMIMADLGLGARPRADHAAYIASWLQVLKSDNRAIFTAASKAQGAADWMLRQPQGAAPREMEAA
ncbi:MAG: ArdC family protein [Methyloceanibacter sp.]